jgi:hypothetical protein
VGALRSPGLSRGCSQQSGEALAPSWQLGPRNPGRVVFGKLMKDIARSGMVIAAKSWEPLTAPHCRTPIGNYVFAPFFFFSLFFPPVLTSYRPPVQFYTCCCSARGLDRYYQYCAEGAWFLDHHLRVGLHVGKSLINTRPGGGLCGGSWISTSTPRSRDADAMPDACSRPQMQPPGSLSPLSLTQTSGNRPQWEWYAVATMPPWKGVRHRWVKLSNAVSDDHVGMFPCGV